MTNELIFVGFYSLKPKHKGCRHCETQPILSKSFSINLLNLPITAVIIECCILNLVSVAGFHSVF